MSSAALDSTRTSPGGPRAPGERPGRRGTPDRRRAGRTARGDVDAGQEVVDESRCARAGSRRPRRARPGPRRRPGRRQASCGASSAIALTAVGHRRSRCPRGRRSGRCPGRRALSNVWIHSPTARKPSTSASLQAASSASIVQLGRRCCGRSCGPPRPAGPARPGPRARARSRTARAACSAYASRIRRCSGPGRRPSIGQVDGRACPRSSPSVVVQRRDQQVERVPGVLHVERLDVRGPSRGCRCRGRCGRGAGTGRAPVVGVRDLVQQLVDGVRRALQLRAGLVAAADGLDVAGAEPRTTLIAATPKPATSVTPSAISWNASSDVRRTAFPGGDVRAGVGGQAHGRAPE